MSRDLVKHIFLNLFSLILIILLMSVVYKKFFYEKDIQRYSDIINTVRALPNDADIVYIGESSNVTAGGDDRDTRYISQFTGDYFPGLKVCDITKPASHAGIFKVLLENIPESNQMQTLVVTLNLRSFDAEWMYSDLETPLQKSIVLLKPGPPLWKRFLLSFKAYDIKSKQERYEQIKRQWLHDTFHDLPFDFPYRNTIQWDKALRKRGIKGKDGKRDKEATTLACYYVKTYAFQIDTLHHPRIKDFDDIVRLAKKRHWHLIFNLMAENTEKARELVGDKLLFFMNNNARLLEDYYSRKGVIVVNNLNAVEDAQFIDRTWTTEHYAEKGRKTIARNLALALKDLYPGQFKEVKDAHPAFQTHFENNCEKPLGWKGENTFTDEKSYSGMFSSKMGDSETFSITWSYPLREIPRRLKNHFFISFEACMEKVDKDIKLVVESADPECRYWKAYGFYPPPSAPHKWQFYSYRIKIPDQIKNSKRVKIYLYDPHGTPCYIDDLCIDIQ